MTVRRLALALVAMGVALAPTMIGAGTAAAQEAGAERVVQYDVAVHIERSGSLEVIEQITYDFGTTPRHGIYRDIPVRVRYDDRYDRLIRLTDVRVSASAGTPTDVSISGDSVTHIRIGDPGRQITGVHTYTISYVVTGALTRFADHDELVWNAVGDQWPVTVHAATARVDAPVDLTSQTCFAGPARSKLACEGSNRAGSAATFRQSILSPRSAFTVVVGLPRGAVAVPAPILEERFSLDRAFARTRVTVATFVALLVLLVGGIVFLAWRTGRDRRFVGSPVDAALGSDGGVEAPVPLFGGDLVPVEFVPPDGLRPGQIGTLLDERANPLDVTATIVDLAARGYLTITEMPGHGLFHRTDWTLTRRNDRDDELLPYEASLLDALFESGSEVKLSELKNKFAAHLHAVQRQLYADMVKRGWYRRRPDRVRQLWTGLAIVLMVAGGLLTIALAYHTHAALPGLAVPIAGLVLLASARWMPRRTAKGTAVRRRALGFREYIARAETDRARFAEQQELFTKYLSYAVVFGVTGKWAKAFEGLDGEVPQPAFFVSPHPFTVAGFESSMHSFTTSAAGTIASTASSGGGSSGFSGGGFGGGGGGSW